MKFIFAAVAGGVLLAVPQGFADTPVYVTNQNDFLIHYAAEVPVTADLDGDQISDVSQSAEKQRIFSIETSGLEEHPDEIFVEVKFNSDTEDLCTVKFQAFPDPAKDLRSTNESIKTPCSVAKDSAGGLLITVGPHYVSITD